MQLSQINEAIAGLCQDVEDAITSKSWAAMTERELFHELIICILGSGVRYEIAVSYAMAIKSSKCLNKKDAFNSKKTEKIISSILNGEVANHWNDKPYKRYRYPNIRATYISESYCNITKEFGSLHSFLHSAHSPSEARRTIVRICPGIGPKQASHFLKNVGYSDSLAILDRHIIKYMELAENDNTSTYQLGSIDKYERIESKYISAISAFDYPVAIVDQAMWFIMRTLNKETLA